MPSQKREWEMYVTFPQWATAAFTLDSKTWMSNTMDSFPCVYRYGNSPTNLRANPPYKL